MDLIELAFTCLMLYFLYKLVVGLIMPVTKAASQMKSKMAEFQNMQQEQMRRQQNTRPQAEAARPAQKKTSKDDDYIDFEEVKK